MLTFLTAVLPFLQPILDWWNKREASQTQASQDMKDDVQAHANEGSDSVAIRDSYDEQIAELKRQAAAAEGNTNGKS